MFSSSGSWWLLRQRDAKKAFVLYFKFQREADTLLAQGIEFVLAGYPSRNFVVGTLLGQDLKKQVPTSQPFMEQRLAGVS